MNVNKQSITTKSSLAEVVQWLEFMLPKHGARVRFPASAFFVQFFFILYFQVKVFQRRSMFTLNQDIWMSNPLIAYFNRHTRSGALRQTRKENAKGNKFGNNHR